MPPSPDEIFDQAPDAPASGDGSPGALFDAAPDAPPPAPPARPSMSTGQAALTAAGHAGGLGGVLSGFFTGSLQAGDKLANAIGLPGHRGLTDANGNQLGLLDAYREGRDSYQQDLRQAKEEHPFVAYPAMIASDIPAMAAMGGNAAVAGAVQGFGDSDADLTKGEFGSAAADTVGGALLGHFGGKVLEGITGALGKLPATLKDFAERRAVKAAGAMLKDWRTLAQQGRINEMGRTLLDEGVVSPLSNLKMIQERAEALAMQKGQEIGDILKDLDAARRPGDGVNPSDIASRIRSDLGAPAQASPALRAARLPQNIEREAAEVAAEGNQPMSFQRANDLKGDYDARINWNKLNGPLTTDPLPAQSLRQVRGIFNDEIERQAANVDPQLAQDFQAAKGKYGMLARASGLSEDKLLREDANRWISPSDYMVAAGEMAGENGGLGKGILAALAHKAAREYGPAFVASTADSAAKGLESFASKPLVSIIQKAAETQPAALGRWAPVLTRALQGGQDELAATHYVLSQTDPGYQDHVRQLAAANDQSR